jgi:hypothetical protein
MVNNICVWIDLMENTSIQTFANIFLRKYVTIFKYLFQFFSQLKTVYLRVSSYEHWMQMRSKKKILLTLCVLLLLMHNATLHAACVLFLNFKQSNNATECIRSSYTRVA